MEPRQRIILPLDVSNVGKAATLVAELREHVGLFKIGLELFNHMFASIIAEQDELKAIELLRSVRSLFNTLDGNFFWDGKWDDIPNTVGAAAKAIGPLRPKMVNVHASAGFDAMQKVAANSGDSLVLAVTVLTSIKEEECVSIFGDAPRQKVVDFALRAIEAGVGGIICSSQELLFLSEQPALQDKVLVTPGVRPTWAPANDQKRVMTPSEAIKAGATYLVVGRPITEPPAEIGSSIEAAKRVADEIAEALATQTTSGD